MKKKLYLYRLKETYYLPLPFEAAQKECQYAKIDEYGGLLIRSRYAWNGCSPKRSLLGLAIIGTPEGQIDYKTGKPTTYYASLVHDALCQYRLVPRKQADQLFKQMLEDAGFPLSMAYYVGVRIGAGWDRLKKGPRWAPQLVSPY